MHRTSVSLLAGLACALASTAPAFAEAIAIDPPPPPPPPPEVDNWDPPHESPHESVVALASLTEARLGRDLLGYGGSIGFTYLQRHGDLPTGFDAAGVFVRGDTASIYDLSLRLVVSPKINTSAILPFVAIGLCAGASRIEEDKEVAHGLAIGPSAAIGLHGFLGEKVYWRASAGFLGAGVGVLTADLGLGMVL